MSFHSLRLFRQHVGIAGDPSTAAGCIINTSAAVAGDPSTVAGEFVTTTKSCTAVPSAVICYVPAGNTLREKKTSNTSATEEAGFLRRLHPAVRGLPTS